MWARIDDQVPDSRKFKKIHPSAAWLWTCGICYCNRYLTDGFIPDDEVPTLSQNMSAADARKYAEQLAKATLWDRAEGGYRVHDYLDIYDSASEVRAGRLATKLAKELYGNQSLVVGVRDRDRDRCRYCGIAVNWKDKRGIAGGVFVYIEREKGNSFSNIVVGCRACHTKVEDGQNPPLQPQPPDRREPIEKKVEIENQVGTNSESIPTATDLPIGSPTYPTQSNPTQSDPIRSYPTLSDPSKELLGKERVGITATAREPIALAGMLPRDHLRHAWCSQRGKCVPEFLHGEFVKSIGGEEQAAKDALRVFYESTEAAWPNGAIGDDPVRLWRREFAAKFPSVQPLTKTPRASGRFLADVSDDIAVMHPKGAPS